MFKKIILSWALRFGSSTHVWSKFVTLFVVASLRGMSPCMSCAIHIFLLDFTHQSSYSASCAIWVIEWKHYFGHWTKMWAAWQKMIKCTDMCTSILKKSKESLESCLCTLRHEICLLKSHEICWSEFSSLRFDYLLLQKSRTFTGMLINTDCNVQDRSYIHLNLSYSEYLFKFSGSERVRLAL